MKTPIPVLRIFDEAQTKGFSIIFLASKANWEHHLPAGMSLYMEVSSGDCVLHLSEHHRGCSPGARVRIQMNNLDGDLDALRSSSHQHSKLGQVKRRLWGSAGNRPARTLWKCSHTLVGVTWTETLIMMCGGSLTCRFEGSPTPLQRTAFREG
ncbi:MAG: glyoxalase superfamily protein [Puniceicoccaceae bacterium]